MQLKSASATAGAVGIIILLGVAGGQAASTLPGGAGTLRESYDSWVLNCRVQGADQANTTAKVTCGISQELSQQNSRQRVLTIGLGPTADGGAKGAIVMPFGLALADGVQLQIDDGPKTKPIAFRTCTPQGCVVPVEWPKSTIESLRSGTNLKVGATSDNGQPVNLSVSLKGFSNSYNRATELLK